MQRLTPKNFYRPTVFSLIFLAVVVYASVPSVSDDFTERRITTGAKIFRALLAADKAISQKATGDGSLRLCLLYDNNSDNAEKAAETLGSRDDSRIRGINVHIEVLPYRDCVKDDGEPFAGIFLTQVLSDAKLRNLIKYSNKRNLVVFSPFEGDVERGVQGGIAVEARVRPYLNIAALHKAGIRLKSFFIRVAKIYEK